MIPATRHIILSGRPVPALVLDFMSGNLDPRISFTATASRYYFNSSGLLVAAGANVPRFDYGLEGTTLKGLLIEFGTTNEVVDASVRDFTEGAWTPSNLTPLKDQVGIDGSANSASSLEATAGNGTILQAITSTSAVRYLSFYLKRLVGTGAIELTLDNGSTWTPVTVTSTTAWVRQSITNTSANPTIGIRIVTSGDKVAVDWAQEEKLQLSSPCIGARGAETAVISGTQFSDFFNPLEGTFVTEFSREVANNNQPRVLLGVNDGSATNEYRTYLDVGNSNASFFVNTSGTQASMTLSNPSVDTVHKIAGTYRANEFRAALDAIQAAPDSAGSLPVSPTQMNIGSRFGANGAFAHLRKITYYNRALTSRVGPLSAV